MIFKNIVVSLISTKKNILFRNRLSIIAWIFATSPIPKNHCQYFYPFLFALIGYYFIHGKFIL